ncbi:guanine nucleotide-binding protein subunit gamma [Neoconidiobolus thromboides FSU 785]|nr:guanine nucleotide-binding protein subunit gamma [Neoconidiobolus thromboides FSU 785]
MNHLSEQKLKKLIENNRNLRQQLDLPRIPVSEASQSLIKYATTTPDYLIPQIWGSAPVDPFNPNKATSCCTVM